MNKYYIDMLLQDSKNILSIFSSFLDYAATQ